MALFCNYSRSGPLLSTLDQFGVATGVGASALGTQIVAMNGSTDSRNLYQPDSGGAVTSARRNGKQGRVGVA